MVVYDDIENFNSYKRLFDNFKEVKVSKTKYSIKIDYGKRKVFLNKGGESGNNSVLQLISKVKKDTENYIKGNKIETVNSSEIFWYYYNELTDRNGKQFEVAKIDLNSAYWTKAINLGIISKDTIEYFENIKFDSIKEKKGARLKALGSLATVKSIDYYNFGKKNQEFSDLIFNEKYRNLYMYICNSVAEDMQTVLGLVNGVYYYWDCIFVDLDSIQNVSDIFESLGYNFTIEKDTAEVFLSQNISYFYCEKTGVKYPIN